MYFIYTEKKVCMQLLTVHEYYSTIHGGCLPAGSLRCGDKRRLGGEGVVFGVHMAGPDAGNDSCGDASETWSQLGECTH